MNYFINLVFCILISHISISQKTYKIEFVQEMFFDSPRFGNEKSKLSAKLFFNDSFSLFYYLPYKYKKDKYSKGETIGEKLIHHGTFFDKKQNVLYDEIAWPEKTNFLLKRPFKDTLGWTYRDQYKTICNYPCKLAYSVPNNIDTIMVWYNEELGSNYGPSYFFGLPGVVLEALDQRYAMHFCAKKVEETTQQLVFPKNNNGIFTLEEMKAKRNKIPNVN